MKISRFPRIMLIAVLLNVPLAGAASAGFGFAGDDVGKSGLNFNKGYDINTVTTVSGHVISSPQSGEKEHVFVEIRAGGETISLNLGPWSYWDKKEIPLRSNDDVTVKGSKAQGKDGKTYLMVQKLTNRTTGAQLIVRDERGGPAWSGRHERGMMSGPGGGMMRGGGRMRGH